MCYFHFHVQIFFKLLFICLFSCIYDCPPQVVIIVYATELQLDVEYGAVDHVAIFSAA